MQCQKTIFLILLEQRKNKPSTLSCDAPLFGIHLDLLLQLAYTHDHHLMPHKHIAVHSFNQNFSLTKFYMKRLTYLFSKTTAIYLLGISEDADKFPNFTCPSKKPQRVCKPLQTRHNRLSHANIIQSSPEILQTTLSIPVAVYELQE